MFEMARKTWYEWIFDLPNPPSIDPDTSEEPEASVPRGTAENPEPETPSKS